MMIWVETDSEYWETVQELDIVPSNMIFILEGYPKYCQQIFKVRGTGEEIIKIVSTLSDDEQTRYYKPRYITEEEYEMIYKDPRAV